MRIPTILITGGGGYFGLHIGFLFAQQGFKVLLCDTAFNHPVSWGKCIMGDFGDEIFLKKIFKEYHIDAAVHTSIANLSSQNDTYHYQDLIKTIRLLEQLCAAGIKKIIFTSSAQVYGMQEGIINHDTVKMPRNTQGRIFSMIEDMLVDYEQHHQVSFIVLRFFCVSGILLHANTALATPNTVLQQLKLSLHTNKPFFYHDTFQQTFDGSIVHDYLHIWDCAHAHLAAYNYLQHYNQSDHFIIGSNRGTSVKQLITTTEKLYGKKINALHIKTPPQEPAIAIADNSKAIDILQWQPQYSALDFILKSILSERI